MANEDNLIPNSERTPIERQQIASKAGKASGESRRRSKSFREAFSALLSGKIENDGLVMLGYDAIALVAFKKALAGDITAMKEIRDTIGEKPTDKLNLTGNDKAIKQVKISFVDKSTPNTKKETDPQIIGEYTNPIDIDDDS